MAKRDFYEVLGVDKNADAATVKSAYRKLAKQYHPDLNPNDASAEAKMKEVNEAYEVLSDEGKRAEFDQYGHQSPSSGGGYGGYGGGGYSSGGFGFEDIFNMFTGGGGRQAPVGPERGHDLREDLSITLQEAFFGVKKEIRFNRMATCDTCKGNGAAPGTHPENCPHCRGTGVVTRVVSLLGNRMQTQTTCGSCRGTGKVIKTPCHTCRGSGVVRKMRTITLTIHPGIENGKRIMVSGEGEPGTRGGPSGDLYVFINIKAHPAFQRKGANLYTTQKIPFTTAALGGSVDVLGVDENATPCKIKPGTQPGEEISIPNMGMPVPGAGTRRGTLYVTVQIDVPKKLSSDQRQLLEQLAAVNEGRAPDTAQRKSTRRGKW